MLDWLERGGLTMVVAALLAAGLGVPLPEDPMLLVAGAISEDGSPHWTLSLGACFVSVLVGDSCLYWISRKLGPLALTRRPFKWILTTKRRKKIRELFEKRGATTILIARHVAGLRSAAFILAGMERMPYRKFIFWDALGASFSVPLFVGLGYFFAHNLEEVRAVIIQFERVIIGALICAAVGYYFWRRARKKREAAEDAAEALASSETALDSTASGETPL